MGGNGRDRRFGFQHLDLVEDVELGEFPAGRVGHAGLAVAGDLLWAAGCSTGGISRSMRKEAGCLRLVMQPISEQELPKARSSRICGSESVRPSRSSPTWAGGSATNRIALSSPAIGGERRGGSAGRSPGKIAVSLLPSKRSPAIVSPLIGVPMMTGSSSLPVAGRVPSRGGAYGGHGQHVDCRAGEIGALQRPVSHRGQSPAAGRGFRDGWWSALVAGDEDAVDAAREPVGEQTCPAPRGNRPRISGQASVPDRRRRRDRQFIACKWRRRARSGDRGGRHVRERTV